MTTGDSTATAPFTASGTLKILEAACRQLGLNAEGADLLRLGENAIFALTEPAIVVRIARTMDYWDDVIKEVAVARWLGGQHFPAAQVLDLEQPLAVSGFPVTFWHRIVGRPGKAPDVAHLGTLLRRLHHTPPPADFRLPQPHVLGRVERRIKAAPIPEQDRDLLLAQHDELAGSLDDLPFPLPQAAIHGDARTGNLMITNDGPFMLDFERFAYGQPEWDLSLMATGYLTAGWLTSELYQSFVEAYGFDITQWSGFDLMQRAHRLRMTTWLMQNVNESPEIAAEYENRMHTIRTGEVLQPWRSF